MYRTNDVLIAISTFSSPHFHTAKCGSAGTGTGIIPTHSLEAADKFRESAMAKVSWSRIEIPCKLRGAFIRRSSCQLEYGPACFRTLNSGTRFSPDSCVASEWARTNKVLLPGFPGDIVASGRLPSRSFSCGGHFCVSCDQTNSKLSPVDEMVMYLNSSWVPGPRPPSNDDKRNLARCIPLTAMMPGVVACVVPLEWHCGLINLLGCEEKL